MQHKVIWPSGRELQVLQVLQSEPSGMYGLEIVDSSRGRIGRASIYVYLGRLEEKGFVRIAKKTSSHPGMPRPIYKITGEGHRALAAAEVAGFVKARA
jgi:PadR family transcriptional regulator, regulatory protein PadR